MNFDISLSSLRASQFAIDTISHNLANANTEGYHRQRVELGNRTPQLLRVSPYQKLYLGSGVDVANVSRYRDRVIEKSYTNSISDLEGVRQTLTVDQQIETLFKPGDGTLHQTLGGFFDEVARLSVNPSELVQRQAVVQKGIGIAQQTREISNRLVELKSSVRQEIEVQIQDLNADLDSLAKLEIRIKNNISTAAVPNDLLDQRDQLVNKIAEKIEVQRHEEGQEGFGLAYAGYAVLQSYEPIQFESYLDDQGKINFRRVGNEESLNFQSGQLVALAESYNQTIDNYQDKINTFASNLIHAVDQAHAQGVGTNGAFTLLRGTRTADATNVPLDQAGLTFPVEKGNLFISVTDPQGEKRTYDIAIDPASDSLADIANKISALGDIQGVVDTQTGIISIVAQPGFRFDFSGNLETVPDLSGISGTSVPRFSGDYQGNSNQQLSIKLIGSGEIGKTAGLKAQVTDQLTGKVIAELDVGENYEAGKPLAVVEGVALAFGAGTVVDGESFTTHVVAQADSTGFLAAVGLNSFFNGSNAEDIAVSNSIINDPNSLASSRSGDVSDTTNLAGLLQVRDEGFVGEPPLTLEEFINQSSADIGFVVQKSLAVELSLNELNQQYQSDIASKSGVDINEEIISLSQYQKQYQAAVQVIRTIEAMTDELFNLIR